MPRREPKFHHDEIFDGAGRSMNALFTIFISGWVFRMLIISVLMVYYVLKDKEVEIVFKFNGMGDWVIYDTGDSGFFSEEAMGIAALYSYGT